MSGVTCTRIIGGPGTGKTTRSMQIIEDLGELGIQPHEIGFASFTRAAVQTAATRASSRFNVEPAELTRDGWFRTLHSACYQMLGAKTNQVISGNKQSLAWLSKCFGEDISDAGIDIETGSPTLSDGGDAVQILAWWGLCRNGLVPVQKALQYAPQTKCDTAAMIEKIRHYERMKMRDGLMDFADMPLRVAGIRHDITEVCRVRPQGDPPAVRAWLLDEYQDTFPAIHAAAQVIASHPDVEFIYASGDPFQSIYGWAAGHPRYLLQGWEYTDEEVLRKSWRCPRRIMDLAERTITHCSDYFSRHIEPRDNGDGAVTAMELDPAGPLRRISGESWLFVARTNAQAAKIGKWLTRGGVPWRGSRDGHDYVNIRQRVIAKAMLDLHEGRSISRYEWLTLASVMLNDTDGTPTLRDGFRVEIAAGEPSGIPDRVNRAMLTKCGATERAAQVLASNEWDRLIKNPKAVDAFRSAADKYGMDEAMSPSVAVGTIHSVKGDEYDNVVLYDTLTKRCRHNLMSTSDHQRDEEYRVWYVGITRAKENLYVARFPGDRDCMLRHA